VIPLLLLAIGLSFVVETEDSIRALNTSPAEMLLDEQQIQQLLNSPAVGQYYLVQGVNHQEILQTEEALRIELDKLVANNTLRSYQAVSAYLPSGKKQQQNTNAIREIYRNPDGLRKYAEQLQIPPDDVVQIVEQFELTSQRQLTYEEWRNWPLGQLFSSLLVMSADDSVIEASVIVINGDLNQQNLSLLESIAQDRAGVSFVNRPQAISALLGEYREQVGRWLLGIYVLIGLVLAWRFQWRSVLVVITPALATLAAMSVLALANQPLTLFHLLASVLVLGIGLDMGIFLHESKGASHAVLAVGASALTTVLAFGLLALSKTPVLHFFGQMALLGILFSWLLAMAFNTYYYKVDATHGL
jgi:predicted exporter